MIERRLLPGLSYELLIDNFQQEMIRDKYDVQVQDLIETGDLSYNVKSTARLLENLTG